MTGCIDFNIFIDHIKTYKVTDQKLIKKSIDK